MNDREYDIQYERYLLKNHIETIMLSPEPRKIERVYLCTLCGVIIRKELMRAHIELEEHIKNMVIKEL